MKSVAIYVRVSTQEQANEGYSIDSQIDRLNSYCKARDWTVHSTLKDAYFTGIDYDKHIYETVLSELNK